MAEQVAMVHKDLPNTKETPVIVSKRSFEAGWKGRGWKLAPKADQPDNEEK